MDLVNSATKKVKVLALHGRGSNPSVTKRQLQNLGLHSANFDIVFANGPVDNDLPGEGIKDLDTLVSGPWLSWFASEPSGSGAGLALSNSICDAFRHVLTLIKEHGPFDCIYGFSQGAVIATLLNNLSADPSLLAFLKENLDPTLFRELPEQGALAPHVILACAAGTMTLGALREQLGLEKEQPIIKEQKVVHLIATEDKRKSWAEKLAIDYRNTSSQVCYFESGHEISRLERHNEYAQAAIKNLFSEHNHLIKDPLWQESSALSKRAVDTTKQLVNVDIDVEGLPTTLQGMLKSHPINSPLLRLARENNADKVTTYGEMLEFISPDGLGDLRRIGVKANEVVAYIAPAGGGAIAATAFTAIASQVCAVPLSSSMTKEETLLALEQFKVDHIIEFDQVASTEIKAAFDEYSHIHPVQIHSAVSIGRDKPGLFNFMQQQVDYQSYPTLRSQGSDDVLLLRTSGTTSKPKVVPLRQSDLVLNATLLADGIGIHRRDVTYSIMPLDHIGGLSASILCSMAVGASITCDDGFTPQGMVEALSLSNPKPTWYSAVPTIHNAVARFLQDNAEHYLGKSGNWYGHDIRFIRSGAANLEDQDRQILETIFDCDIVTTYSMSEQMPVAQPPKTALAWHQEKEAVGVPVIASLAIVDPMTHRPLGYGEVGEIAISGTTVFKGYADNPQANESSRFVMSNSVTGQVQSWFKTGDLGELDNNGTLTIKGRLKELIKKGGEQVAPAEVESIINQHPWIKSAVCFSVPSQVYGEEVGCALVLEKAHENVTEKDITNVVRRHLRGSGLASFKVPTVWKVVLEDELPKTNSKKYKRNGLADVLGVSVSNPQQLRPPSSESKKPREQMSSEVDENPSIHGDFDNLAASSAGASKDKPFVDWSTLGGLRFLLACYVMFMHIGSNESWGAVANLRQFPWHVHTFFALAGFSLVVFMPPLITKKFSFVSARVKAMYPLYALAVVIAMVHLLTTCQPGTFTEAFQWGAQPNGPTDYFCQGTPLVQDSWLANVLLTFGIHLTGLQATPLWGASWFLGFYLWFISMYFQCLIIFPMVYNALYKNRGNTRKLLTITISALLANFAIVMAFWYGYALDATGYGHFDPLTGLKALPSLSQYEQASTDNAVILGFYLFSPFWIVYFIGGMCAAFVYDAVRPSEHHKAQVWGYIADGVTVVLIAFSIAHIAQGYIPYNLNAESISTESYFMRPEAADSYVDAESVNRIWDNIYARLFAPLTLLWIFALSTGQGITAKLLRFSPISSILAPTAYACFLFHQMVGQWYYAITRHGEWWNWWSDQKTFYWFSPQPVAVEWYEYFYVVGLVVLFAKAIQPLEPAIRSSLEKVLSLFKSGAKQSAQASLSTSARLLTIVESTTGVSAEEDWSLEECGLASLGIVQFCTTLENEFSSSESRIRLSANEVMEAPNISAIAKLVDEAILDSQSNQDVNTGQVISLS